MTNPEMIDDGRPSWRLYCGTDLVYVTTSKHDSERWVAADPEVHTSRMVDLALAAEVERLFEENRETLERLGRGGWTGATGLEDDAVAAHQMQHVYNTDPEFRARLDRAMSSPTVHRQFPRRRVRDDAAGDDESTNDDSNRNA